MIHVLYIVEALKSRGGIETALVKQIPALRDVGIAASVVSANGGVMAAELQRIGVDVFLPEQDLGDVRYENREEWKELITSAINSCNPNLLYPHQIDCIFPCIEIDPALPIIAALRSNIFDWIKDNDKEMLKNVLTKINSIHAVGHVLARELNSLGADNIIGIFPPTLIPDTMARPRISPKDPKLIFVGRPDTRKGLDVLIKALAYFRRNYPEASLEVFGNDGETEREHGGGRDRLFAQSNDVNDMIVWRGSVPRSEVIEGMSKADLLICPSHQEAFSGTVAEAHSLALPVVGTSAVAEVMNWGKAGIIVPSGNSFLLSQAMLADLSDIKRVARAYQNRQWILDNYSLNRLIEIMLHDFQSIT